ncbi:MAG: tetratricopeptide repeat-containing sulfotransferase family protein [Planctomycetota bacterium]|jgi:tetratricopeptide (TPR) repeat protein
MALFDQHASFEKAANAVQAGDFGQAEAICQQLLKRNKRDVNALQLRGQIALKRGDLDQAARHFARCVAIRPRDAEFHFLAGVVASQQGNYADAIRRLDKALALKPDYEPAVEWKAVVLEWDGDYERARAVLEPSVAAGTESPRMAETQARVEIHDRRYRQATDVARRHLDRPDLPADARSRLGHVAGNAYERLGEYDQAFEAHTDANRAVAIPFDASDYTLFVNRLLEVFSAERVASLSRHGDRSQLPIFIAGMPRSGTTLVEQIIDAHPLAHGAGELHDIEAMASGLQAELGSTEPYPECAADLEPDDISRLAGRYLGRLRGITRSAQRVADKSLVNFRHLGLIAAIVPAARIIHCRRDPRDTCVSCYMSGIYPQALPFITDLHNLGFAYRQYERLMEHWSQALPQPILEVVYEAVVDDLEGESRRIIEFCGLDWDDGCLEFHASGRNVRTASYEQVRQPIYRSSIGRYERFERHLGPLLEALAADPGSSA